ncbi:Putative phage tail assembly protein, partial [Bordetella avium 197N]
VIAMVLIAALAAGAAWMAQGWRKDAVIAAQAAAFAIERDGQAQATVAAIEEAREEGRRRTAAMEDERDKAQRLAAAAAADAAGARNERDRLRSRANALARAAADRDPAAANGSPPGAAGADLLAYMLGRVSDRATELAAIADRARVAGLTCERIYDGLSK